MSIGARAPVGDGRISTVRRDWMGTVVLGGLGLVVFTVLGKAGEPGLDFYALVYGVLTVAAGLWMRTFAMDLRPEAMDLRPELARARGFRQPIVPWPAHVQAVAGHTRSGSGVVRPILESGTLVRRKAPTCSRGPSTARHERDFALIGERRLAHGQSWRPRRPEAPRLQAAS